MQPIDGVYSDVAFYAKFGGHSLCRQKYVNMLPFDGATDVLCEAPANSLDENGRTDGDDGWVHSDGPSNPCARSAKRDAEVRRIRFLTG